MISLFEGRTDFFGNKLSKKQFKKEILNENKWKGKMAEENVKMRLQLQSYETERSPRGKDFIARKRDIFGRVIQTKYIEVKSGNVAKLSKLQQQTKSKKSNYQVIRDDPLWI